MRGIKTETVTVQPREAAGTDDYGNDVFTYGEAMKLAWRDLSADKWREVETDAARDTWGELKALAGSSVEGEDVAGVIVRPSTARETEDGRVHGTEAAYTLYFPKGTEVDLRGARVMLRGRMYDVIGDPQKYPEGRLVKYDLVANVERHDG